MASLAQMDHLLAQLGEICFVPCGAAAALRWAEADPGARAHMLAGPHADWAEVTDETIWGAPQRYFWFAGDVVVPEAAAGRPLWLEVIAQFGRTMGRSDPQCLVRIDGQIVQAADFHHRRVRLAEAAEPGRRYEVMIEAGTIEDRRQIGFACQPVAQDVAAEALYFDLATPLDVARHLPETDHRRDLIRGTVYEALNALDLRPGNPERQAKSVARAREIAAKIYETADTEARPVVTVTGHTHIDVAWLWRVRETRQKMARSVSTALRLMDDYPDYVFMYNQGYLLDTLAQDYPELFEALRGRRDTGQFEVEGALWLEPDANMTGSESLVRHILKGVRYHQETFGVRPRIVWLPDTFGYCAALPQVMALAGLEVFVTHKMSWNDTNRMPNEVFWWEGIDGTRVPTYFLTTQPADATSIGTNYGPDLTPSHVMGALRRYAQKETQNKLWLCYGLGDGGGGPTREMLERIRRMEKGIPGCPKVEHGPMGPFFSDLVARMRAAPEAYPAWVGELYLEFHRGTFTSVAEVKRNNRGAEAVMREVEALAVLADLRGAAAYPAKEIAALWDVVLLNQFHDILPGSSIGEVYADSRAEFEDFFERADRLKARLAGALGGDLLANPFGTPRRALVRIAGEAPVALNGAASQGAVGADGTAVQLVPSPQVPATGAALVTVEAATAQASGDGGLSASAAHLENAHLRAEFDSAGRLVSLTDKATGREALTGLANRLQAFRDLPAQYDAWDIDLTYQDQQWEIDDLVSAEVVETGPYRAAVRFEWRYEASRIVQVISLEAAARQLEVDCVMDWRDPHTLVKAAFPLAARSAETVAETQFGHVRRPTHRNTSWDAARFEAPMHRWVAMAEPGFGAALLNDCKYGYDAEGSLVRLSLLRAPTWPWDGADIGRHQMRYGIAVFEDLGEVPALAEAFNHPMTLIRAETHGAAAPAGGLVEVAAGGIAVEAVKRSEDGASVILRLWEREGRRQVAQLAFDVPVRAVWAADLLEAAGETLEIAPEGRLSLAFGPFEIRTLKVQLA